MGGRGEAIAGEGHLADHHKVDRARAKTASGPEDQRVLLKSEMSTKMYLFRRSSHRRMLASTSPSCARQGTAARWSADVGVILDMTSHLGIELDTGNAQRFRPVGRRRRRRHRRCGLKGRWLKGVCSPFPLTLEVEVSGLRVRPAWRTRGQPGSQRLSSSSSTLPSHPHQADNTREMSRAPHESDRNQEATVYLVSCMKEAGPCRQNGPLIVCCPTATRARPPLPTRVTWKTAAPTPSCGS